MQPLMGLIGKAPYLGYGLRGCLGALELVHAAGAGLEEVGELGVLDSHLLWERVRVYVRVHICQNT